MTAYVRFRGAFTLVELVVAIGILVLMLTMAGTVFSLTLRSTGQAKALTDLSERLRMYERTLTEDLRAVRPASSMMALECREVYAHWTPTQKDLYPLPGDTYGAEFPAGGDPERTAWHPNPIDPDTGAMRPELPRADVLTFFTAREAASVLYPSIRSNLQLVSYSHVKPGDLDAGGNWVRDPDTYFNIEAYYVDALTPPWTLGSPLPLAASQWMLGRRQVLVMNTDPGVTGVQTDMKNAALFDGRADIVVSEPGGVFDYHDMVVDLDVNEAKAGMDAQWRRRAKLDTDPPAVQADRMGAWFLPNCASFKVEWALSHPTYGRWLREQPEMVWVDSTSAESMQRTIAEVEKIRDTVYSDQILDKAARDDLDELISLFDARFVMLFDASNKRISWVARDPTGQLLPGEPDPFFPTALRITVDLYDDTGRLDRPIRHVMVVPVGAG